MLPHRSNALGIFSWHSQLALALLLALSLLSSVVGLLIELDKNEKQQDVLTITLPGENDNDLIIEFVSAQDVDPFTAYGAFLNKLAAKRGVVDIYSWNACIEKISDETLRLSGLSHTLEEMINHLKYLTEIYIDDDKAILFVTDFRGPSKSYVGKFDKDTYDLDTGIRQSQIHLEQLFHETSNLLYIASQGTAHCGADKFNIKSSVKFSVPFGRTATIVCGKEAPKTITTSGVGSFFVANGKLKKDALESSLFKMLSTIISGAGDPLVAPQFFISEGCIKHELLKVLVTIRDFKSVNYLDMEKDGRGILCMLGEIIMNGFKRGNAANIYFKGKRVAKMDGRDYFYSTTPLEKGLVFKESSEHDPFSEEKVLASLKLLEKSLISQDSCEYGSFFEDDLADKSLTTVYQKEYKDLYGLDGPYAKIIKSNWPFKTTLSEKHGLFSIEILPSKITDTKLKEKIKI